MFFRVGEFFGPINLDLSDLALGVFPLLDVNLSFTLNEPRFFLQCEPEAVQYQPTYEILDLQLLVLKRTLPTDNYLAMTRPVVNDKKSTMQQYTVFKMTSYPIAKSSPSYTSENFLGSANVGTRIIIAFCTEAAFTGNYAYSPFYFCQQFGDVYVNQVNLTLDSEDLDGFSVMNATPRANARVHYQRFLRFLGTSQSANYTSGIGFGDFAAQGGVSSHEMICITTQFNVLTFSVFPPTLRL